MVDCEQFAYGSRQRQVCLGESELSLEKTNRFRARFGLDPLDGPDIETATANRSVRPARTITRRGGTNNASAKRGCCGGGKASVAKLNGHGPGSQLMAIFKAAGFESCEACEQLAIQMDRWAVTGCKSRHDAIVDDILPRAIAWEAERVGWLAKLIPEAVTRSAISALVTRAIDTAEIALTARRSEQQVRRRHVPQSRNSQKIPSGPTIEHVDLSNVVRHLTYHIYPVKGYGVWQWNCEHLLQHAHLFNGRKIVSIVTDETTDSVNEVKAALSSLTDEFIVLKNDKNLREVISWIPMLERLESYQSENDVTFSAHAKAVRHEIGPTDAGSTIFRWTSAMWETCGRWESVQPLLEQFAAVGSFRRFQAHSKFFGPTHFSGTFFWWRNRDAYRRSWRTVPKAFFGTEAWPGLMFSEHESGVIACDHVDDLYKLPYWENDIEPQLAEWRLQHAQT